MRLLATDYDHDTLTIYKFLNTQKNSYIVFLHDNQDNHYIVKQEKEGLLHRQFRAISEVLCAYIACQASIPSHHVALLPIGMSFPGKFITKRVATLHTLMPGTTIRSSEGGKYSKIDLKQETNIDLPFDRQGFNERTIFYMSLHEQLPKIVALDTFIGNKDRNKANILYDSATDSFYVIDMALMHDVLGKRKRVAQIACEQVISMIDQKKKFTKDEVEALLSYRAVLQELVQQFPPRKTIDVFEKLLIESGLLGEASPFEQQAVDQLSHLYKRAIKESYKDIKRLIYLLYILINN